MKYLIGVLLFLNACANTNMSVTTKPTILPNSNAPEIVPLNLTMFKWKVLTDNDLKDIVAQLPNTPDNHIAIYALDSDNYAIFDADVLEMQRFIAEQSQVIIFYKALENDKFSKDSNKR